MKVDLTEQEWSQVISIIASSHPLIARISSQLVAEKQREGAFAGPLSPEEERDHPLTKSDGLVENSMKPLPDLDSHAERYKRTVQEVNRAGEEEMERRAIEARLKQRDDLRKYPGVDTPREPEKKPSPDRGNSFGTGSPRAGGGW